MSGLGLREDLLSFQFCLFTQIIPGGRVEMDQDQLPGLCFLRDLGCLAGVEVGPERVRSVPGASELSAMKRSAFFPNVTAFSQYPVSVQ